jgi:transitional endoplasmic reticulum ATPase
MNLVTSITPEQGNITLLPSQLAMLDALETEFERTPCVSMAGRAGIGKSVTIAAFAERHGATVLDMEDYISLAKEAPHEKWGERVFAMIHAALERSTMLIVDDYSFSFMWRIDRERGDVERGLLREKAQTLGKRLLFAGRPSPFEEGLTEDWAQRGAFEEYDGKAAPCLNMPFYLTPEDMRVLVGSALGARASEIDFDVVHIYAAHLLPRELLLACAIVPEGTEPVDTRQFLTILGEEILRDTISLGEVETVTFADLPGTEHIADALEQHVVLPFEHPEEARASGVKARRGVMLFGPPGTGKTSVGRALAHRLRGKFFLIDGTIPTEPPHIFLARVMAIIERAVANAPAVLFLDDADSLFTIPYVAGVVRKLLSLLDGMESQSASRVCVMMTVMDPMHIPEALLRSGRVELWLELQSPDEATRARMFDRWTSDRWAGRTVDHAQLAAQSPGFTPADIRRAMNDARLLEAQDRLDNAPARSATEYALAAISDIVAMRTKMANVLHDESLRLATELNEEQAA